MCTAVPDLRSSCLLTKSVLHPLSHVPSSSRVEAELSASCPLGGAKYLRFHRQGTASWGGVEKRKGEQRGQVFSNIYTGA